MLYSLQPDPSLEYLQSVPLPNDDRAQLPVKQVAAILLAHLNRLGLTHQPDDNVSAPSPALHHHHVSQFPTPLPPRRAKCLYPWMVRWYCWEERPRCPRSTPP